LQKKSLIFSQQRNITNEIPAAWAGAINVISKKPPYANALRRFPDFPLKAKA
jgi:hypothetical protein